MVREAQQVGGVERRLTEEEALQGPEAAARNQAKVSPGQQTAEPEPGPPGSGGLSSAAAASSMRRPAYSPASMRRPAYSPASMCQPAYSWARRARPPTRPLPSAFTSQLLSDAHAPFVKLMRVPVALEPQLTPNLGVRWQCAGLRPPVSPFS